MFRDFGLRFVTHPELTSYISPLDKDDFERFLGEKEYQIIHRGYNIPPPGGESFAMVEKRVKSFIKYLKSFIKKNRVNVAISAHGNSIRLFMKIMENLNINETEKLTIPYDKVFMYKVSV